MSLSPLFPHYGPLGSGPYLFSSQQQIFIIVISIEIF
jgi:hypothetical protein